MAITRAQQARQMLEDGGPMRKIKGQDHMLAYITPNEADKLVKLGGQETMTPEGILAYPEFDNYTESSLAGTSSAGSGLTRDQFEGGAYSGTGNAGDGVIQQYDKPKDKPPPKKPKKTKDNTLPGLNTAERLRVFNLKKLYDRKMGLTPNVYGVVPNLVQSFTPNKLDFYEESDPAFDAAYYGMSGEDITDADRLAKTINEAEKTGNISQTEFESAFYGPEGPPKIPESGGGDQVTDPCKGPNPPAYCFVNQPPEEEVPTTNPLAFRFMADGGRAQAMDGGIMNVDMIGGMMDGNMDEMGRQMYGLGKLVKKATRGIKKLVKSPVGKIALLAGGAGLLSGGGFGLPSFLKSEGLKKFFFKGGEIGLKNLTQKGLMTGIGALSALPFIFKGDEEEEFDPYRGPDIDIDKIRSDPYAAMGGAYRFAADGGIMRSAYQEGGDAEPVAKKTMPLIDMDGKEKDYRETGGFVDMGRMERADDVPARLSKNEFVFTADAVRNAGEGNIDKGAEVMYNMMKNLEAGGEVSEESQGLEGARNMFQTSQRLEEVL